MPTLFISCTNNQDQEIFLTEEERNWLEKHEGQIRIGYTTDYPPVEFLENGEYVGISADYFELLEEKLNTTIEMVEFRYWNELINQAKNHEISGITAATKTPERSEYLDFTVPYVLNPNVIITRENFSERLTFEKLAETTMEILVVEDYAIIEFLDENYPKLEYREVLDASAGLREVSFGEADAMVVEVMSASASIDRDNLTNLIVNTETPYESNLSIATRNDWPILNEILNKGLAQISESERQQIKSKWIPFERRNLFENPYFWIVLGSVIILLVMIIIVITTWNNTLKNAVKEKTFALEASKRQLEESRKRFRALAKYSTDIILRFDKDFKCLYANPAVEQIIERNSKSIIGCTLSEMDLPKNFSDVLEDLIVFVFNQSEPNDIVYMLGERWYHWSLMPEFSEEKDLNNNVSAVIISARDITDRKVIEEKIRYKSYHDELTGLHNRAYFNEKLEELNHEEYMPLSIILADLNGLKITNDTLGHKAGDQLLIKVSRILEETCREEDIIARIGGDEFVILLPNTTKEITREICDKIKTVCKKSPKDPIKPSVGLGYATKKNNSEPIDVVFKTAEDNMYHNKMYESESSSTTILKSLEELLRESTNETSEHSERLKKMGIAIGKALNLPKESINELALLADLHDLGKVAIPKEILFKKEALTIEEWERVKRHPEIGFKIASSSPKLTQIANGILSHHERWDGTGYPEGLIKEEIPLLARIISIVDAYDVMTTGRPYKQAVSKKEAIKELKACSGSQFDPRLVEIFTQKVL